MLDNPLDSKTYNLTGAESKDDSTDSIRIPVLDKNDVWKDEKQPWASSATGRLMIRTLSRGVMGAAFYAVGGHVASKGLEGYVKDGEAQNAIQHIAGFFDKVAGRPIEKVFGENAVTFRPTLSTGARSLGEDVVDTTFNFACATAGDAIGRNIVGMFDPNCKSKWRDKDGKISFPKAVKSVAASTGKVVEAQMADWFVSVPYIYQKRAQRNLLDKISPGFGYDSDRALNGSSFKLSEDGKIKGTYGLEGALDLQARFTGYNIGTMFYYDAVDAAKQKVKGIVQKEKPIKVPVTPEKMYNATKHSIGNTMRYAAKSAVKAAIIMTPSVPSFWAMRVTQSKDKSMGIMPDGKPITDERGEQFNIRTNRANVDDQIAYTSKGEPVVNPFSKMEGDPFTPTHGIFDTLLNPLGRASYEVTKKANTAVGALADNRGWDKDSAVDLSSRYVNGAMAYTPYIYTKNEFAHRWNNPEMDGAIYRALDGVSSFNRGEIKAGFQDIRKVLRNKGADVNGSHPETIPESYDRATGEFVRKVSRKDDDKSKKDTSFASKHPRSNSQENNWQEQVNTRNEDEFQLSTR
ncbi:MAG: hypothetical protein MK052_09185 [Alphaproteobacteria bacterium]|nr:hypothetical protein [Alphaproteobacteria bacterium]